MCFAASGGPAYAVSICLFGKVVSSQVVVFATSSSKKSSDIQTGFLQIICSGRNATYRRYMVSQRTYDDFFFIQLA